MLGAAARQYNTLKSIYDYVSNRVGLLDESGHEPLDIIRGTKYEQNYLENFVKSRSSAETKMIMSEIDQEEADKALLAKSGWAGTVASIGMGILDPTILMPVGAGVSAIKGGLAALRVGAKAAAASALQAGIYETALYSTKQTRTIEDLAIGVGTATMLGGVLNAADEIDRGPLANAAAAMVEEGLTGDAVALLDSNAAKRRDELIQAAKQVPEGLWVMPMAGTCLMPLITDGDIVAIDPFGNVEPGEIAQFKSKSEPFHLAKVFIGLISSKAMKTVFNRDFRGTVAIFWMADPEAHLFYALDDLEYVARVDGRVGESWYSELGSRPLEPDQLLASFGDPIEHRPLACFGCPPITLLRSDIRILPNHFSA